MLGADGRVHFAGEKALRRQRPVHWPPLLEDEFCSHCRPKPEPERAVSWPSLLGDEGVGARMMAARARMQELAIRQQALMLAARQRPCIATHGTGQVCHACDPLHSYGRG